MENLRKVQIVLALIGDAALPLMFYFKWLEKSPVSILTILVIIFAVFANILLIRNVRKVKRNAKGV